MFKKCLQLLKTRGCAVLFAIVLISACTVSAGAVVTEESGDGKFFYNWLVAPELPAYRPAGYDYSVISYESVEGMDPFTDYVYFLVYCDRPLLFDGESLIFTSGENFGYVQYLFTPSDNVASLLGVPSNSWVLLAEDTGASISVPRVNWSDYSLANNDGDVISTYTDPISLDGFNIIRWDGIQSNVEFSNELAIVGDYLPVPVSAYSVTGTYMSDGTISYNRGVNPPLSELYINGSDWSVVSNDVSYVVSDYTSDNLRFLSRRNFGIGNFTQLLAYKPDSVSSDIDFSKTSLTVSNPQYDYQSAEFDVSWSNLPEISYPDDIQYFLRGRLSDGAASQPPEIYLGSSDDPPEATPSVSFSFTDLQPETQYSATFELVYNDTGSFRDFISSGVSTTVSFTTLSDGSISEGDKAIINAIQQGNKDNQQWIDSNMGAAVGDLPEDTAATDSMMEDLDQKEEAYKDDAYSRFQELSSSFSGFDGSVGSGIGLAGTLFSRFFNALGTYKIIYTFPLLLGLAMVLIGRLGRSMFRTERESDD